MARDDRPRGPGGVFEGRYEIVRELGMGGFGTVYEARRLTTGQPVALKIMRPPEEGNAMEVDRRVRRFLREAQLCAQLHHPNLVQIVDSGRTGEGLLYTVFAYAPGETLADLLAREGALEPAAARHLMLQVLDALACAHAEGVVHRDLKPSNVLVVSTGARRNAVVLDFGIGALARPTHVDDGARLTPTDDALGTPGYAAPEQLGGLDPSPRADLFSWGLVFLECLTGEPVYAGGSSAEILYAQLGPDPVPLPAALQGHPLGDLLAAVTRKDAARRDLSAAAALAQLEACDLHGLSRDDLASRSAARRPAEPTAGAPAAPPAPDAAETSVLEGERRQLTAVCCVFDAAPPGPEDGAEHADELLRVAFGICVGMARRHGGHVASALGDEVLLYFGYPRAQEDDARRAARAALAIGHAVGAAGDRLAAARAGRVVARVGVHTGLVITPHAGATAAAALGLGATSRVAARAAARAPAGGVAATADARRLLRAWFELEPAEPRAGDAAPEGSPVFRLLRERGAAAASAGPDAPSAPLVGRDHELDLLVERWRRARAGAGQCSLITGEPGIGKSRLARELRARIEGEAHFFLEGRCSPDTPHSALYPVLDLLGRALELAGAATPREKAERLAEQLARRGFSLAETMPIFLPLFSLPIEAPYAPLVVSSQRQKELTLEAILSLLFAMAEERPMLLLFEDLHWCDPTTIELLSLLLREAPSAPMCLVVTARPEFSFAFPTSGMLQLVLYRLDAGHVATLVSHLAGRKALPPAFVEQVARRTDGVPLFVEELTRVMIESGVLVERDDRYELARPLSRVDIPSTLRDLLAARLDRLGRAKETAQIAAALGREFSVEELSAVSLFDASAVSEDLERLASAGLLYRKRRAEGPAYVFKHALVRDAAYDSLPRRTQKQVHARIARTLEERLPDLVAARPDLLASHHAAADQKREAIRYAQRAAQGAIQRSAFAEAIEQVRQALEWLPAIEDPRERAETELALNGALAMALMAHRGQGSPEVAATLARSQELIDQLGDSPHAVPTLWAVFANHHVQGDRAGARAAAERLVSLAERAGDVGQEVAALPVLGQCLLTEGRFHEARPVLERAIARYDPQAHRRHGFLYGLDSRVVAHMSLAITLWFIGVRDEALRHADEAASWAHEIAHAESIGSAWLYAAMLHQHRRRPNETREAAEAAIAHGRRHGLAAVVGYGGVMRGWARGDPEEAGSHFAMLQAAGQKLGTSYWNALVADSEAARGRYASALERIGACLQHAEQTGERYYLSELLRLQGAYLLESGASLDAALESLRGALDTARRQGAWSPALRAGLALTHPLRKRGDVAEAATVLADVRAGLRSILTRRGT